MLHFEVPLFITILCVTSATCTSVIGTSSECQHIYNTSQGEILSPNFPQTYPDYVQCDYFIRPRSMDSEIIKLEAKHFDLEGGYDYLEIREVGPDGRFIGVFSGDVMPTLYAKSFWVRFVTDHSIVKTGFKVEWSVSTGGIRLVNGSNPMEGRVELFYNSTWGTVCDDAWGKNDAKVVCHMLGLPDNGGLSFAFATYGKGSGRIWLDNVGCYGNETSILNCILNDLGQHNCNHGEDAGVRCPDSYKKVIRMQRKRQSFPKGCGGYFNDNEGQLASPQFPLYPNFAHCEYYIYPEESLSNVTRLAFKTFGLEQGADFLEIREDGANGPLLGRFTGGDLPPVFFAKRFYLLFTSDNSRAYRGFQAEWFSSDTGVRLRNGTWFGEGRFELFYNRKWNTACDHAWDNNEATVICTMLGYMGVGAMSVLGGTYGTGTGPIILDNVGCLGNETSILDCSHRGLYLHNCPHREDVGVICGRSTMNSGIHTPNKMDNATIDSVLEAVNITCGSMTFTVDVDLLSLNSLFPFLDQYNQYFSLAADEEGCRGEGSNSGALLTFDIEVTNCGMLISETEDSILFHNRLVSHTNVSVEAIAFRAGQTLAIPVECTLSKTVILANRLRSFETHVEGETVKGYGNFSATMEFYKDPSFALMIYDYPAYVQLGQELGVEITLVTRMSDLTVVIQNCWATSKSSSPVHNIETAGYFLIQNRCPVDQTTHYAKSDSQNKSRFLFKTFEYIRKQNEVYIVCNLLVCNETDQSARCISDCDVNDRHDRSVDQPGSDLQVVQGPLVFKGKPIDAKKKTIPLSIILGVVVAVIAVMIVVTTIMVVRSRKQSADYSPPYSEYETKYEKVAMLDFD